MSSTQTESRLLFPREEIAARVRAILVEQLSCAPEDAAQDAASLRVELGVDEWDMAELAVTLEETFGIQIADDDAERLLEFGTVGTLITNVEALVVAEHGAERRDM